MEVIVKDKWVNAVLYDADSDKEHRVIERYKLPGKHQGCVLVCSQRQLYWQYRHLIDYICVLPEIHYEDRASVVTFTSEYLQRQMEEAYEWFNTTETGDNPPWPENRIVWRIDDKERG
jgi:hypothetical protein